MWKVRGVSISTGNDVIGYLVVGYDAYIIEDIEFFEQAIVGDYAPAAIKVHKDSIRLYLGD